MAKQAQYRFKHALVGGGRLQSLPRRLRQAGHHGLRECSGKAFPETAETQPELLAHHYTEAGQAEAAVPYWQHAGQRAVQRSAHVEAVAHLTQGLTVLTTLPETPARWHQELDLQVALGPALMALKGQGAPDVARAYGRARELCQQLGDTPQLFPVLRGLMMYYLMRGQVQEAHQLGEQLLRLAHGPGRPGAPHACPLSCWGKPRSIWESRPRPRRITRRSWPLYPAGGTGPGGALRPGPRRGLAQLAGLGAVAAGLRPSGPAATARRHAPWLRRWSHPYSLAFALIWAAVLHQFRHEVPAVHEQARAAITLATEQGFALPWPGPRSSTAGPWPARARASRAGPQIRQGLAASLATGDEAWQPYCLGLLAAAYGRRRTPRRGVGGAG